MNSIVADKAYFMEVVMLALGLGSPVFLLLFVVTALAARRGRRVTWSLSLLVGIVAVAVALVLTLAIWLAAGALNLQVPEPVFMLGGAINSFALVASLLVFAGFWFALTAKQSTPAD